MKPITLRPDTRLMTKYYWILFVVAIPAVIGLVAFIWLIAGDEGAESPFLIALVIGLLANALWMAPTLLVIGPYWRSLEYVIEDDEVIVRGGVITKSVKHVPYRTVTNLKIVRDPFDRILGIGTLNIQTAGMSGQTGAEESLSGLVNYDEVYERVATALRRYRSPMGPSQADEDGTLTPTFTADEGLLGDLLAEVRAIRDVLDPAE